MRKHLILVLLIVAILTITLCSCSNERNDRQYTLSELIGTYNATGTAYSSNEYVEYTLTIYSDGTAAATRTYTNASSSRYNPIGQESSSTTTEFSGNVTISKTHIKIGDKTGYVTSDNGRIVIHINDREYK